MKRVACLLAISLMASAPLLACPICFQVEESRTTDGLRAAVLVLVVVTVAVLSGFAYFITRFVRRSAT